MAKESFISIYNKLKEAEQVKKDAESNISLLKDKLRSLIPANEERGGVIRKTTYTRSISYAKAYPELKKLMPKTKHEEADAILEDFTSEYPRDTFKAIEE